MEVWGRGKASVILDDVRSHYRRTWGEPTEVFTFRGVVAGLVEVWKWSEDSTPEGVVFYATIGASERPMRGVSELHRVEYFMPLLPADDAAAEVMAGVAVYPRLQNVALDHGHTIPISGLTWNGVPLPRVVMIRQSNSMVIPTLLLENDVHVEFLETVPIYEAEFEYKAQHGVEALLREWHNREVPYWESGRPPVLDLT